MSTKKNISYRTRHYEISTFFNASANLKMQFALRQTRRSTCMKGYNTRVTTFDINRKTRGAQ